MGLAYISLGYLVWDWVWFCFLSLANAKNGGAYGNQRMTFGMLRSFLQWGCPWRSTAELAAKQGGVEVATWWLLPGIVIIITFIHRRKWSFHIDEVEKLPGKLLCDKTATYLQGKMKTLAPIDKMSRICSAIQHTSKASQLRSFLLICLWFSLASIY